MAKKIIRLTESDLTNIVKRVISEQVTTKSFACERGSKLSQCLRASGYKGNPMFDTNGPAEYFGRLYQIKSGDTWYGIMNNVLGLDGYYGIKDKTAPDSKQRRADYERYSKINLDMNPKLGGNMKNIKAGDILHLEAPYN